MNKIKHIAIIIESSRAFGRGLVDGICEYAKSKEDWQLHYREATTDSSIEDWLKHWKGDAIIARISNKQDAETLAKSGIPVVDLLGQVSHPQIQAIDTDHRAISSMAADFFKNAGFSSFGYCGYNGVYFSDLRRDAFVSLTEADVSVYDSKVDLPSIAKREAAGHYHIDRLANWLKTLNYPCAIFACNDVRALDISISAREAGLRVPQDIAILGVDDDSLICNMANPPNSSVRPDTLRQGYTAAFILNSMMQGKAKPQKQINVLPIEINERSSTDHVVTRLEHVAIAYRYLRANISKSIGTDQIAQFVGVSKSLLDRDFKKELGRSVSEELKNHRLQRIKTLLIQTEFSLDKIALLTGFAGKVSVSNFFKKQTGSTPGIYRQQNNYLSEL